MKTFFYSILFALLAVLFVVDIYAAIKICSSGNWQLGLAVGFPAYAILCVTAPVTLLLSVCLFGAVAVKIEDRINRSKKYQY